MSSVPSDFVTRVVPVRAMQLDAARGNAGALAEWCGPYMRVDTTVPDDIKLYLTTYSCIVEVQALNWVIWSPEGYFLLFEQEAFGAAYAPYAPKQGEELLEIVSPPFTRKATDRDIDPKAPSPVEVKRQAGRTKPRPVDPKPVPTDPTDPKDPQTPSDPKDPGSLEL